jgi:hypothetical protein
MLFLLLQWALVTTVDEKTMRELKANTFLADT